LLFHLVFMIPVAILCSLVAILCSLVAILCSLFVRADHDAEGEKSRVCIRVGEGAE